MAETNKKDTGTSDKKKSSVNLAETQRAGREAATAARNARKGSVRKRAFIVAGILFVFAFVPNLTSNLKEWAKEKEREIALEAKEKAAAVAARPPLVAKPRIIPVDVTLLPHGTERIAKVHRCNGYGIKGGKPDWVKRDIKNEVVEFTSKRDEPFTIRVWFYDEGGDCKEDFDKLINARLLL